MRKTTVLITLALVIALCMVCAVTAQAEQAQTWEDALQGLRAKAAANSEKYAPAVKTLDNGVKVQRTPADYAVYNTRVLKADTRGCAACHADLGKLMDGYDMSNEGYYNHFSLSNDMGIETTYTSCLSCHYDSISTWYVSMSSSLHGIHDSAAFDSMGGDCWSCHYTDKRAGYEWALWDEVKYSVLHGVSKIANVEGVFSFDQDVKSGEEVYNVDWMYGNSYDEERMSKVQLGVKPDPANDGVYENWKITVTGEVDNELTLTLADIIANGPKVTKMSKSQCTINPNGGPLIANVEITGVPLSYITDQAGIKNTATMMCVGATGFGKSHYTQQVLSQVDLDKCYLVYEINGDPIPYEWGYPVMSWYEGRFANENVKGIGEIILTTDDPAQFTYNRSRHNADGVETVSPNLAICNFSDGQVISALEPYTFEGYADAFDHRISAVEFSFDNGATWTTYETRDTTTDRWVYWNFEWTPPQSGAFVISARAVDEFGKPCYRVVSKLVNVQ